ncbi:IS4 family transposase [Petrocella sp. FN5]|uniref:IS4 family transposase n=1 Tax=Petrocella sp. FN5 TaxID=3032002 RepID=UPI0023DB776B|nr:IS4 family transposase [Petrocella sp. FN5]MDF1618813.1 IS4 family transposase [Petrocella sp. FN5]
MNYSNQLKMKLFDIMDEMASAPSPFVVNPNKDFTRKRKLDFATMLKFLLTMNGNSIDKELLEFFDYDESTATCSAFVQQRKKIKISAFLFLLKRFVACKSEFKTFRGYRLLAIDGSKINIPHNPLDVDSYKKDRDCVCGYNLLSLNAIYDLLNRIYIDARIRGVKSDAEKKVCCDMVDESTISEPTIIVADRGYEGYNVFCHTQEKGWKFVIRIRDKRFNSLLLADEYPETEEFDISKPRNLTYSGANEARKSLLYYKRVSNIGGVDISNQEGVDFYTLNLRFVRFKLGAGSYELIVTNLDKNEFSANDIKKIYNMRWGIETSFRELKYSVGLNQFHSKEQSCIEQEILGKLIMYNYCSMITSQVIIEQYEKKLTYQSNFTRAVQICKYLFNLPNDAKPPNIEALIRKYMLPVRNGRSYPRQKKKRILTCFNYRIS